MKSKLCLLMMTPLAGHNMKEAREKKPTLSEKSKGNLLHQTATSYVIGRKATGFNLFIARTNLLIINQLSESSRKKQVIVEFS